MQNHQRNTESQTHALPSQVFKPKVVEKESDNLSGMFFQRSKKSTPKSVKQAAQEAKQAREEKREDEEEDATSTPHTRTAGMATTFKIEQHITVYFNIWTIGRVNFITENSFSSQTEFQTFHGLLQK